MFLTFFFIIFKQRNIFGISCDQLFYITVLMIWVSNLCYSAIFIWHYLLLWTCHLWYIFINEQRVKYFVKNCHCNIVFQLQLLGISNNKPAWVTDVYFYVIRRSEISGKKPLVTKYFYQCLASKKRSCQKCWQTATEAFHNLTLPKCQPPLTSLRNKGQC